MTDRDFYPSRTGGAYRFLKRRDPVVRGSPAGPLTTGTLRRFAQTGFLHRPAFLSPETLRACRQELRRMRDDESLRERAEAVLEPEGTALRTLFAVHLDDGPLARLCRDPRLAAIARQILGSDVYVHQSRINCKPGFRGQGFFWHSDFETWHVEDGMPRMRAISCSIALDVNHETNGPLLVIPGSHIHFLSCAGRTPEEHYKRSLRKQELGIPDEKHLAKLIAQNSLATVTGPAGSVTFFDCNLMHGSNSNITPWPRSNVFVVFNSVENRLRAPYCGLAPRPEHIAHRECANALPAGPNRDRGRAQRRDRERSRDRP